MTNKNKNITYKEIAKMAGVGVGTVSRYFNNYNISDKAKAKIEPVVTKIDYKPNYLASTLKRGNQDIYLVLPYNYNQSANLEIISGAKEALAKHHCQFLIQMSSEDPSEYLRDLEYIVQRKPQGLILLLPKDVSPKLIEFISKIENIETVIYNREGIVGDKAQYVSIDDYKMFYDLTIKVLKQQKQIENLVFIGLTDQDMTTGLERKRGFNDALKKANSHLKIKILQIKDNKFEQAYHAVKTAYNLGFTNFICATHTIFMATFTFKVKHKIEDDFFLTDIGSFSLTRYLIKPNYEIFVDYFLIGYVCGLKTLKFAVKDELNKFKIIKK